MKRTAIYIAATVFLGSISITMPEPVYGASAAQERKQIANDRRNNRQQIKQDHLQTRSDNRQSSNENRRESRQDRNENRRENRQDRNENRRENHQDRNENRRENRQDRNENRRENRQDWRQDRRQDRRQFNRRHTVLHYSSHRVGVHVNVLPGVHVSLNLGGSRFYYSSGVYYRPAGNRFVVVTAPIGASIAVLPFGYVDFHLGPRRFYYVNRTYYVYEPTTTQYVVVEQPEGVDEEQLQQLSEAEPVADQASPIQELVVYPAEGQSDQQVEQDRYECHRWSADESGFNPVTSADDTGQPLYLRAMTACLQGRGYSVN